MKAISLHQPWASCIADGQKTIETRKWQTHYRGELLIVSTQKPKLEGFPTGQALCTVTLYDCVPMEKKHCRQSGCAYDPDLWAWMLRDIRAITPFPVKGYQGFYEVDSFESRRFFECDK